MVSHEVLLYCRLSTNSVVCHPLSQVSAVTVIFPGVTTTHTLRMIHVEISVSPVTNGLFSTTVSTLEKSVTISYFNQPECRVRHLSFPNIVFSTSPRIPFELLLQRFIDYNLFRNWKLRRSHQDRDITVITGKGHWNRLCKTMSNSDVFERRVL